MDSKYQASKRKIICSCIRNLNMSRRNIHVARKDFEIKFLYMYHISTRGDQKVRGKVLLYHIAFIDSNENSKIETSIQNKLT